MNMTFTLVTACALPRFGGAWLVGQGLPFELARSRVRDPERAVSPHALI